MSVERPPGWPRVGFVALAACFLVGFLVFVVLFATVEEERFTYVLPAIAMLLGLNWTRNARRAWLRRWSGRGSDGSSTQK